EDGGGDGDDGFHEDSPVWVWIPERLFAAYLVPESQAMANRFENCITMPAAWGGLGGFGRLSRLAVHRQAPGLRRVRPPQATRC
ncbi:MAG: hypothetical protein KDG55_21975, partial [Rhodocyclaceae bacterium]|nr:hypothetical protein [Rhodocyclaceae bacterium]